MCLEMEHYEPNYMGNACRSNVRPQFNTARYPTVQLRLEGGTRCGGNSEGRSCPSILTRMRCIARANSSSSRKPSLSMSASFQILPSTEFGSFDFTISVLAAVEQTFYFELYNMNSCCIRYLI